jgi:acyl-CoA synthetase (AMP-forming)/AMP-acid ligase II
MMEHGAPLIGALVGTLLAGRCFAVLDPAFPPARNRLIVAGLGANVLLGDAPNAAPACAVAGPACRVRIVGALPDDPRVALPGLEAGPDSALGIFHTTGTTGEPKGVLWQQALPLRRAITDRDDVPISPGERFSLLTALCFPAAVSDTFNALLNGASLHLYDMRAHGPAWLPEWLRQQRIDHLRTPVALFRTLHSMLGAGEWLADLQSLGLSGDALSRTDVLAARKVLPPDCRIIHRYSMSEAGMVARDVLTATTPIVHDPIPPGFIAPGKRVRILDEHGSPAGAGEFGEVCVDLEGCAAGYWRNGHLEPLPAIPDPDEPGRSLYRSGDAGRLGPDGRLELAGRQDHRVKIRGYRVEMPAVERALRDLDCVQDAAVSVTTDASGERSLCAFVVPRDGADVAEVRTALAAVLPEYMVPARFVALERLPLAGNGKLDRKALHVASGPVAPPQAVSEVEGGEEVAFVCGLFAELLGRSEVGPDEDFFGLGGHSLLAARALARINVVFDRRIPLASFYRKPTANAVAAMISDGLAAAAPGADSEGAIRRRALQALGWLQ